MVGRKKRRPLTHLYFEKGQKYHITYRDYTKAIKYYKMSLKLGENFRESVKSIINIFLFKNRNIGEIVSFLNDHKHTFLNYKNEYEELISSLEKYKEEKKAIKKESDRTLLIIKRPENFNEDFDEIFIRRIIDYNVFIKNVWILYDIYKENSFCTEEYINNEGIRNYDIAIIIEFLRDESTQRALKIARIAKFSCFASSVDTIKIDNQKYDEFVRRGILHYK